MLPHQAKHQGTRPVPETLTICRRPADCDGVPCRSVLVARRQTLMDISPYCKMRRRGQQVLSPDRFYSALSPRADFVPAIADGVFEAFPGVGMARLPVAAGVGFEYGPVPTPVTLVRA